MRIVLFLRLPIPRAIPLRPALLLSLTLTVMATALTACSPSPGDRGQDAQSSVEAVTRESPTTEQAVPDASWRAGVAEGASILLVTLDTTRADRLGSYGYARAETPHLDRLAAEGVRFDNAATPVPMTLPAHVSLMTAQQPPTHGVRANGEFFLGADAETLAEVLAGAGYRTGAFVSAFVLDGRYGLDQGFATYDAAFDRTAASAGVPQTERTARAVTDRALAWLREEPVGGPFFAWVHYFDPHDPYQPPEPWASRFAESPYDGEIAAVDEQIGRLLAEIEARGPRDRVLVAVTADHGESLGEHFEQYHGKTLYEAAVRVPMILRGPGLEAAVERRSVSLVDLAPTLLDLVGIEGLATAEGTSLASESFATGGERPVYLETLATFLDNGWAPLHGARTAKRKYIRAPRPELYDLAADPGEARNLLTSAENGDRAESLSAFVDEIVASGPSAGEVADAASRPDPEALARLQALGYMTGGGPAVDESEAPDPKDVLPLYGNLAAAREAVARGDFAAAERLARELLVASPNDRTALQVLGEAYAMSGREDQAERALRRLIDIKPTPQALALLAQIVFRTGRAEDAEALLDQGEALDPGHGAIWIARGDISLFSGKPDEALRLYREAMERDRFRVGGLAQARIRQVEAQLGSTP